MKSLEKKDCLFPSSLSEALDALAKRGPSIKILAGGSDLMVQWQDQPPNSVLYITSLPELRKIEEQGDYLRIGAAVSHRELGSSDLVEKYLPALNAAAKTVGARQIQNIGTIGGNVANASPAGDLAPALMVSRAKLIIASKNEKRRVALDDFFLDYRKINLRDDELIIAFEVEKKRAQEKEGFKKLGPRKAQAISKIVAAYRGELRAGKVTKISMALGSVAATTLRLRELERSLEQKDLTPELVDEVEVLAREAVSPIDDIRSSANYRKWVSGRLVRRFLEDLMKGQED